MKEQIGAYLDNHETIKTVGDVTSIGIAVGTIIQYLPAVAALLTIVWTSIRIFETKTVQNILKSLRR